MKFFLASEAKHPESMEKLRQFIGGSFKDKKLAYIPTAANGEFYGHWKNGGSIKLVTTLEADIRIIELESCIYQDILQQIIGTDIIWFAGGMPGYLLYWIRRSKLDKILPEILSQGTIYVGSSAGSMVCSKKQSVAEWYIGDSEPGASVIPGLGYIDFEIYPHYDDELLPEIKKRWNGNELYLLKNGEAITVVNDTIQVLGEKRIIKGNE